MNEFNVGDILDEQDHGKVMIMYITVEDGDKVYWFLSVDGWCGRARKCHGCGNYH